LNQIAAASGKTRLSQPLRDLVLALPKPCQLAMQVTRREPSGSAAWYL